MATHTLDVRGLRCPQPTLKMTIAVLDYQAGDLLEVMADCPTFESDVRAWAERTKKPLLWIRDEGSHKRCQVRV